jgi:transposase-like protein
VTGTLVAVQQPKKSKKKDRSAEEVAARELVAAAKAQGLSLTGPDGLWKQFTKTVLDEMAEWVSRPLNEVYAAIFIDAIVVKVRDGQVTNRPVYAAIGVTLDGEKEVLGYGQRREVRGRSFG